MPKFAYIARDQRGTVQVGHLDALEEEEVVAILQHRGLLVTSVSKKDLSETAKLIGLDRTHRMHGGVTIQDQVQLCQQLATLVGAGVPLLRAIEVVSVQAESRVLLNALREVHRDVEGGRTFRDALVKHPAVFSKLWLNLVETGEASGHLSTSLQQLARQLQSMHRLRTQAQTAMTYPAFLIVAAVLVLALFVYWLIPKFTSMFVSMGMELPLLTKVVIAVSHVARKYVVVIVLGVGLGSYGLGRYLRTSAGQWTRDRVYLQVPVLRPLFVYLQLAEFSRGLATLLESGVPLLSTLEILENSMTNKVYGRAVGIVRESVKEGKTVAEPMQETGMFPPMVVQMIQVGEEVGELAKMCARIADYYEERVSTFIERMTRLFEPVAIVVMGGLVLVIVLAIFMPIFNMAGGNFNIH